MGLWFEVTREDCGFDDKDCVLEVPSFSLVGDDDDEEDEEGGEDEGDDKNKTDIVEDGTEFISFEPDYSEGDQIFIDTFLSVAYNLVPVDTGFLMSSIHCDTDGDGTFYGEASADYAQYVEYGTYKMEAQPYFVPALAAAMDAALPYWRRAYREAANDAAQEYAEEVADALLGAAGSEGGLLEVLVMMVVALILMMIMTLIMEVVRDIFSGQNYGSNRSYAGFFVEEG